MTQKEVLGLQLRSTQDEDGRGGALACFDAVVCLLPRITVIASMTWSAGMKSW